MIPAAPTRNAMRRARKYDPMANAEIPKMAMKRPNSKAHSIAGKPW